MKHYMNILLPLYNVTIVFWMLLSKFIHRFQLLFNEMDSLFYPLVCNLQHFGASRKQPPPIVTNCYVKTNQLGRLLSPSTINRESVQRTELVQCIQYRYRFWLEIVACLKMLSKNFKSSGCFLHSLHCDIFCC